MSLKSNFYLKILLVIVVMIQVFCNEQTEQSKPITTKSSPKTDTTLTENFATAQIILDIETASGNILAYSNLDLYAPVNNKGKYKVKTFLVDNGDNGPFISFTIVDKAVISKNGEIKVLLSFEVQTQRLIWETEQGKLTGAYGQSSFKQAIKSEGGSLKGTAALVFDEKSMNLLSQNSVINENMDSGFKNDDSSFEKWYQFAAKHLKVRLATSIHWTNAACKDLNCTTGQMRENK